MSVTEVSDGLRVKCNHFYVIPPNASMSISEDTLHLGPREESRGLHMPVVNFMRSLAEQKGNRAIGVIMSGSDGTLGMAEIQAHGGVTFAQDEATAKYYGMPRSVVVAGCVDYVLPPKGIAREVTRIARHPYVTQRSLPGAAEGMAAAGAGLDGIFQALRRATGVDFTDYRQTTILRRIQRRSENTERLLRNARSAFFSALHYVQRSELAPCDVEAITARLVKLQEALQESVPQQESAMLAEGDGWADSV
jgi:two-component system CheB/CheR fusion protein